MEISLNRFLIPICWMGIICIVTGCTSTVEVDERSPLAHIETLEDVGGNDDVIETFELGQFEFVKVLLFSKNGMEIQIDASIFQEQWDVYTMAMEENESEDFSHMYTVVLWDKQNQPYVLQFSDQGFKIGQKYYSNREGLLFHKWIQEEIGERYLQALQAGQLFVAALDLSPSKKQVSEEGTLEMINLLQSATLLSGEVRIETPLYPYYELYAESTTVGNVVITVLSPTLLSVKDGMDTWYYQLSSSIFSRAKETLPIPFFSTQHIKHIFEADEIIINHEIEVSELLHLNDDALKIKAIIHEVCRVFSLGQARANPSETIVSIKEQEYMHLEFLLPEGHTTSIIITEDSYIMNDTVFYLKDVGKRIQNLIGNK